MNKQTETEILAKKIKVETTLNEIFSELLQSQKKSEEEISLLKKDQTEYRLYIDHLQERIKAKDIIISAQKWKKVIDTTNFDPIKIVFGDLPQLLKYYVDIRKEILGYLTKDEEKNLKMALYIIKASKINCNSCSFHLLDVTATQIIKTHKEYKICSNCSNRMCNDLTSSKQECYNTTQLSFYMNLLSDQFSEFYKIVDLKIPVNEYFCKICVKNFGGMKQITKFKKNPITWIQRFPDSNLSKKLRRKWPECKKNVSKDFIRLLELYKVSLE